MSLDYIFDAVAKVKIIPRKEFHWIIQEQLGDLGPSYHSKTITTRQIST